MRRILVSRLFANQHPTETRHIRRGFLAISVGLIVPALLLTACARPQGPPGPPGPTGPPGAQQAAIVARQPSPPDSIELPANEGKSTPIMSATVPPGTYVLQFSIYFWGRDLSVDFARPDCQPFDADGNTLDSGRGGRISKLPDNGVAAADITGMQAISVDSSTTVSIRCANLSGGPKVMASHGILALYRSALNEASVHH